MLAARLKILTAKMATVIRVKRRLDEEPLDALILNCKKRKINESEEEVQDSELSTVLKFAGTLESQEEDVLKHLKKPTKAEAEGAFKKHIININEKIRQEVKKASLLSRLKVVNCFRSSPVQNSDLDATTSQEEAKPNLTIVDIEPNEAKEEAPINKETSDSSKYVYDLYYTNSDDFGEIDYHDELVSVYPLSADLVYGSRGDNGANDSDSDKSEDSNAENNWRNDYPDESDLESITEDDMVAAVKRIDLNGENELSSDEGEEGFAYSIDSEAAGFEEDIDPTDVRRYGEMYARFKSRNKNVVTSPPAPNFYYGDIDEDEYYY